MLADVATVFATEGLVVTVEGLVHQLDELAALVLLEQLVVVGAPQDLDDVPACAAEECLELLNDLAVTANGPSRRCRLQLTTKVRLSRCSFAASCSAPRDSGSSISPSPRNAQTCCSEVSLILWLCRYLLKDAWWIAFRGVPDPWKRSGTARTRACNGGAGTKEYRLRPWSSPGGSRPSALRSGRPQRMRGSRHRGGVTLEEDLVTATGVVTTAEEVVLTIS